MVVSRIHPKPSSDQILENHEQKSLYCHITKSRKPLSVKDTTRMIAKLGDFLGRKHDKEPGMIYIQRGWGKADSYSRFLAINLWRDDLRETVSPLRRGCQLAWFGFNKPLKL